MGAHVAQETHVIFVVRHGCGERGRECAVGESARELALDWAVVKVGDLVVCGRREAMTVPLRSSRAVIWLPPASTKQCVELLRQALSRKRR